MPIRSGLVGKPGIVTLQALGRRTVAALHPPRPANDGPAGFEKLPAWLFFAPVALHVLHRGIAYGDLSLPALANPRANAVGMGSSKSRQFAAMSPEARRLVAPFVAIHSEGEAAAASTFFRAIAATERAGLAFPLVAKPDRGARGQGVRVVRHEWELRDYVVGFPAGETFLLQALVEHEHEAGIMYTRHPEERTGRITSLALKQAPVAVGDGQATVRTLIERHPRAGRWRRRALERHEGDLDRVPPRGERVELVFTRSHCAGAACRDGRALITPDLVRRIDAVGGSMRGFHVGRFDVRFSSLADLRAGRFTIIEVNGGASEPLHAWDPGNGVLSAWRAYFDHVDLLYRLGDANRARGYASVGTRALLVDWWRHHRLARRYTTLH